MRTMTWILAAGFVGGLLLAPTGVSAEKLSLSPSHAVVLPDDESGITKVALLFDLSEVRSGEGWHVDIALLDWSVSGVASNSRSEYVAFPILTSWSVAGISGGQVPTISQSEAAAWDIEPLDYQRNQGGFLRFDLTELARDWTDGTTTNYGVILATEDLSRQTLSGQLSAARLTIHYGYVGH